MSTQVRSKDEYYIICDWCKKELKHRSFVTTWPVMDPEIRVGGFLNELKTVWANWISKPTHHFHAECVDIILRNALTSRDEHNEKN